MRQAMSASRGSSGVHKPRPNMPHSHSGASASTMSTPNERADRDGRGGEINSPPTRVDPRKRAIMRPYIGLKRVVHDRSEEHTSELQSQSNLVCRLLLEKKKRDS